MRTRMNLLMLFMAMALVTGSAGHAATITYSYDAQHRLVQASYSASQKVFYNYDATGNVDQHVVITDGKYLQSWLLYFSMIGWPFPNALASAFAVNEADKIISDILRRTE